MWPKVALRLACGFMAIAMARADAGTSADSWQHIELEARKFLLVARSSVTISLPSADELASQLVAVEGHDPLPVPSAGVLRIDALSRAPGVDSQLTVWLARDNLQLLQRERLDSVHGGRYKLTRFLEDGSYEWQRRGKASSRNGPPSQWSLKREKLHVAKRSAPCTDSLALLLLAGDLARSERVRMQAGVCTDDGAFDVVLTSQGDARETVPHVRVRGDEQTQSARQTPCRRVGIAVEEGQPQATSFRLLGLTGRLQVCVDVETGAPLNLLGTEPTLGEFRINTTLIETSSP